MWEEKSRRVVKCCDEVEKGGRDEESGKLIFKAKEEDYRGKIHRGTTIRLDQLESALCLI